MASSRFLQDSATLFLPVGEDEEGVMQYDKYLLENVKCEVSSGVSISGNKNPDDGIKLYIFDRGSSIYHNGEAEDIAESCEGIFYTIRNGEPAGDDGEPVYILPYSDSTSDSPPDKCLRVTKTYRRKAGTTRMWHWEVHGQ